MNILILGGDADWDEKTYARYWNGQYRLIEADRAFARGRWAARLRRLARLPSDASAKATLPEGGFLPLHTIVGYLEGRTGVLRPLPPLKRRWKEAWRRLWTVEDIDKLPALAVIRGPGGWYLTETPRAFLVLGVLAAKGIGEARVRGTEGNGLCVETEAAGRRIYYRLVKRSAAYACCDETEGVAV